jgi:hypothetical protein
MMGRPVLEPRAARPGKADFTIHFTPLLHFL